MIPSSRTSLCLLAVILTFVAGSSSVRAKECAPGRSPIDYAQYFNSLPKDSLVCGMAANGSGDKARIVIDQRVSNPALSCPDMFAWKLFAETIKDRWWVRWADEEQNWPSEPYPRCAANESPHTRHCCAFGSSDNDPKHCPVFPGAGARKQVRTLRAPPGEPPMLRPSFAADVHGIDFRLQALAQSQSDDKKYVESLGRIIRQDNNEYTVRNQAFHDFVFSRNLYNTEGLVAVFRRHAGFLVKNAPYRAPSTAEGTKELNSIDFPPNAIMIKSNWVKQELAQKLNLKEDPLFPYIKKEFENKNGERSIYWLVAFHISSKDIPNWVWATFEHVSMPGRCDITGCNDSFGYLSADNLPEGAARNFVAPKTTCDRLNTSAAWVFKRDQVYAPEQSSPGLTQVLEYMGIGIAPSKDPKNPEIQDAAWRSYRLKGTQVDFADSTGRATILGNSITEAGFMNGSSCITCHARAGTDELGPFHADLPDRGALPLGVFINEVGDFGYGMSARGLPDPAWFNESNTPPRLHVLQTDFVWGFLFARPTVK